MAGYDPITELSDSPYPEMRMAAFDSPMAAHETPDRYLARMRGHGYDIPAHTGEAPWSFVNRQNLGTDAAGQRHIEFFGDFYNRILFTPGQISFGNILSTETRGLDLWNAYLEPKDLTDYVEPVTEGLTISEPVSAPYTFSALEGVTYAVTASTSGPPQFAEEINWTIDGQAYAVEVTGQRVVVWPFAPDWGRGLSERLSWMTDLMTAFDGTEQRVELRSKPRRGIEYTAVVTGARANTLKTLLFGWQNRKYALPIWQDKAAVREPLPAGTTSIAVDTQGRSFVEGGYAVVLQDDFNYEVVEVDNVLSDAIVLVNALENDWPAGVRLLPVNLATLPTAVNTRRLSSTVLSAQMEWQADPVETDPYLPDVPAVDTHNGYEVIYLKPNWAKQPDDVAINEFLSFDGQTGGFQQIEKEEFPRQRRQYQWLIKNRANMADFRAMLGRLKGRLVPVYVPTWFSDFELFDVIGANSSTMKIRRQGFDQMVGVAPTQNTLLVRLRDGTQYLRTIVATQAAEGEFESINVDTPFPVEIQPEGVMMISLVHLMRLETDSVTINHRTDSVSTVEMTMTTVNG